ncbi:MAG: hypothetical protein R3C12_07770 [Planctomycetaceae bacterium]
MARILFLHGWHSVPGGVKPTHLKDHGHSVLNPSLNDDDFDATVRTAQAEYDQHQPDVIPFSDSEELVAQSGLPPETLIEVGQDHRLADPEPLRAMLKACERLTQS